jgi:hypothetical protein
MTTTPQSTSTSFQSGAGLIGEHCTPAQGAMSWPSQEIYYPNWFGQLEFPHHSGDWSQCDKEILSQWYQVEVLLKCNLPGTSSSQKNWTNDLQAWTPLSLMVGLNPKPRPYVGWLSGCSNSYG